MNPDYALKNHLMLEESHPENQKGFEKRIGRKWLNPPGIETPLGHTYSLGLELLASEKLDATPEPEKFVGYLDAGLYELHPKTTLMTPTFAQDLLKLSLRYFKQKGMSVESLNRIVAEVLGPNEFY